MLSTLILYAVASLAVTIVPGPTMLLALSNGTSRNLSVISMGILGAACSDLILIGAVAMGLGAIMLASELLFSLVKWAGVMYLLWLAWSLWRSPPATDIREKKHDIQPNGAVTAWFRSLFAALSNPKGLLFFSAFLPQFLITTEPAFIQYLSFALISTVLDIVVMAGYAFVGYQSAKFFHINRILNRTCAAVLALMAAGLTLYRRA